MKKLNSVKVLFENPEHNYETNVSAEATEETVKHYFVGKYFDLDTFPKEDFHKCIGIEFTDNNVVTPQDELDKCKKANNKLDFIILLWPFGIVVTIIYLIWLLIHN